MAMSKSALQRVVIGSSVLWLSSCGLLAPIFGPVVERTTTNVNQAKDEGYLQFTNGTSEHQIFVDGRAIGTGNEYSSGKVLAVPSGPHLVEVTRGGAVVVKEKVFIETGSTRPISLQ
jgi:hypothetical protein